MRAAWAHFLNTYPLITPVCIAVGATVLLAPVIGEYAPIVAIVIAAKLTSYW